MDRFQREPFFLDTPLKMRYSNHRNGGSHEQETYGFDPDILGNRRIFGISSHIRNDYQKYGEFTEGHKTRGKRSSKWSWQINGDEWSECHLVDHCGI